MARQYNLDSGELYEKIGVLPSERTTPVANEPTYVTGVDVATPGRKPKPKPLLPFEKQLPRLPLQAATDVHPLRFVPFNDSPAVFSKTRRIRCPKLGQYLPRGLNLGNKDLSNYPEYKPNYQAVCRNTDRTVAFGKSSGRAHKVTSQSLGPGDLNVNLDSVRGQPASPRFDKDGARPQHNLLPSFMLGSTHRQGLQQITNKSFQMNGYPNRDYLRLGSTFGSGWTAKPFKASPVRGRSPKLMIDLESKLAEALGTAD